MTLSHITHRLILASTHVCTYPYESFKLIQSRNSTLNVVKKSTAFLFPWKLDFTYFYHKQGCGGGEYLYVWFSKELKIVKHKKYNEAINEFYRKNLKRMFITWLGKWCIYNIVLQAMRFRTYYLSSERVLKEKWKYGRQHSLVSVARERRDPHETVDAD